jgi:hypothetical protein
VWDLVRCVDGGLGFDFGKVGVGMKYGVGLGIVRLEDFVLANYVGVWWCVIVSDSGGCSGILISHLGHFVDWNGDLEFHIYALCLSRCYCSQDISYGTTVSIVSQPSTLSQPVIHQVPSLPL